jgi:hypothetical protein
MRALLGNGVCPSLIKIDIRLIVDVRLIDYLLPDRHHHDHQIVGRGFAVADAEALTVADVEVDGCRFADGPDALDRSS